VLLAAVAGTALGLVASEQTTFGDEARFAAEARAALQEPSHPAVPSYDFETYLHFRAVGVFTTTDEYGGPITFQPGPAAHLLAWPFVRLLGPDLGAWVFALAVNLGALSAAAWAAGRRGGPAAATCVICGGLVVVSLTTGVLTSALNVRLVVLPVFATLVVAWAVATADVLLLPLLSALWSFVLQTHIGYALLPSIVVAGALVMMAVRLRQMHPGPAIRRPVGLSLLVLGVAWVLPVVDQVTGSGNLFRLLTADLPSEGLGGAWRAIGALTAVPPLAAPPEQGLHGPTPAGAALVVGLLLVAVLARRRLHRHLELLAVAGLTVLGAVATAAMSPPGVGAYHLYWVGITVGFSMTAAAIIVVAESSRSRLATTASKVVSLAAILLCAIPVLVSQQSVDAVDAHLMAAIKGLEPEVRDHLASGESWNITSRGGFLPEAIANAIGAHLQAEGYPIRQSPESRGTERSLVVASADPPFVGAASVIARHGTLSALGRSFEASASDQLTATGSLELLHPDTATVVSYLDGRAATVCPSTTELDRSLLAQLDSSAIAGLYAQAQVLSPELPSDLGGSMAAWSETVPFAVLELARPSARDQPVLSQEAC
jgi:hypothetical protein